MQSQASVESGENKLICPHYEKKTLCPPACAVCRSTSVRCRESEMTCWQQAGSLCWSSGAAGKAKQQAASSFVTVYLLTGPMLLGIPAREKQREKHFTAPTSTHTLLGFWSLPDACLGARNTWECPHITKTTFSASAMTETCSSKLSKVAMRCFLTDVRCTQAQSHKEAIKGHRRWGTYLILLLSARPSIIQFPLPDSRRGDNKVCLIPMVTRSPRPGHCWAVDLRRWRHPQDSCKQVLIVAEMSSLVCFLGFNLDGRSEHVNSHTHFFTQGPPPFHPATPALNKAVSSHK